MVWNFVVQLAIGIALSAISYVLTPRQSQKPPPAAGIDDLDIGEPAEGTVIVAVFGTVRITAPRIVARHNLRTVPIQVKGGKK